MDELAQWLLGALDNLRWRAEYAAERANVRADSPWQTTNIGPGDSGEMRVVADGRTLAWADHAITDHVARNDLRSVLARIDSAHHIVAMHGPTAGYRDNPDAGEDGPGLIPSDDPNDLMYPEAAKLCRTCGPGDTWQARQEPWGKLPCDHLRWLAYGHRFDAEGWRDEWAPPGVTS